MTNRATQNRILSRLHNLEAAIDPVLFGPHYADEEEEEDHTGRNVAAGVGAAGLGYGAYRMMKNRGGGGGATSTALIPSGAAAPKPMMLPGPANGGFNGEPRQIAGRVIEPSAGKAAGKGLGIWAKIKNAVRGLGKRLRFSAADRVLYLAAQCESIEFGDAAWERARRRTNENNIRNVGGGTLIGAGAGAGIGTGMLLTNTARMPSLAGAGVPALANGGRAAKGGNFGLRRALKSTRANGSMGRAALAGGLVGALAGNTIGAIRAGYGNKAAKIQEDYRRSQLAARLAGIHQFQVADDLRYVRDSSANEAKGMLKGGGLGMAGGGALGGLYGAARARKVMRGKAAAVGAVLGAGMGGIVGATTGGAMARYGESGQAIRREYIKAGPKRMLLPGGVW